MIEILLDLTRHKPPTTLDTRATMLEVVRVSSLVMGDQDTTRATRLETDPTTATGRPRPNTQTQVRRSSVPAPAPVFTSQFL